MRLLEALDAVTETDLDEIERAIAGQVKIIDALKDARRIVQARLGLKKPKAAKGTGKGAQGKAQRSVIAEYLANAGSPQKPATLAAQCGVPMGSITAVLNHPWFERFGEGVRLTAEGKKAVA